MRKRLMLAAAVTVLAAGVVGGGALASGGPVMEASGFPCGVFDADDVLRVTTNSYFVQYSSGKMYLRCEADGTNSSGVVHTTNFEKTGHLCFLGESVTTNWHTRHSRDGTAQLTCTADAKHPQEVLTARAAAASAGQG